MSPSRSAVLWCLAALPCAAPAARGQAACTPNLNLSQIYRESGLRRNLSYEAAMKVARQIERSNDLHFREVFRPISDPGLDHRLMATNPHLRGEVVVCAGHVVELYFGRLPFRQMPENALQGLTLGQAQVRLRGLQPARVVRLEPSNSMPPSPEERVAAQWPLPGQPLYDAAAAAGSTSAPQAPLIVVATASRPPGPPEECPRVVPPPAEQGSSSGTAVAAGVAGVGAGVLAMRLAQRGSPPSGPARQPPAPAASLPVTRVRPDFDRDAEEDGNG